MELLQNIPLSVRFLIDKKRSKDCDDYLVYARILLKRDKAMVSLKLSVSNEDWDKQNEQFYPTKKINLVRNNKLREVKDKLIQIYYTLKRSGIPVSAKGIKNIYDGKNINLPEMKFMDYYKQYVEEIKLRPDEYGVGVIKHYNKVKNHLDRFLKLHALQNIKMSELGMCMN